MGLLCGVDIIEINRIENSIKNIKSFKSRIFTAQEIEYCESKKINKYKSYAARFAAKEAVFKALDAGKGSRIRWSEIEVKNTSQGTPKVLLSGRALQMYEKLKGSCITISLSHCDNYAVANVVVSFDEDICINS